MHCLQHSWETSCWRTRRLRPDGTLSKFDSWISCVSGRCVCVCVCGQFPSSLLLDMVACVAIYVDMQHVADCVNPWLMHQPRFFLGNTHKNYLVMLQGEGAEAEPVCVGDDTCSRLCLR